MTAQDDAALPDALARALAAAGLGALAAPLAAATARAEQTRRHGDREKWRNILQQLAEATAACRAPACDFAAAAVRIGEPRDCDAATRARIKRLLLELQPWRKGPFALFGVDIDAEWRSDRKWARLAGKISPLRGRRVLDVGCGNGYYLWRMLGEGAALALGIDPGLLFIAQFNALKHRRPDCPAFILPLRSDEFPAGGGAGGFDTVFSMGVLSHRRDPQRHLRELLRFARPGSEVVVETLVTSAAAGVFTPAGRYAKMRNVHAIPSPPALEMWLKNAGAGDIQLLNISTTTPAEQRATEWMRFESLANFLDPNDPQKTIEGHPAPRRAIFLCKRRE